MRGRALGRIPTTLLSLNSLNTDERRSSLLEAVDSFQQGLVVRPQDTGWVNVLARTFFSYSADDSSPSRLAWEAVIRGLSVIGCCDRDNLGALGEMFAAGDALGVRTTVSLETKAFVESYADREIGFPGEPGFVRAFGVGFSKVPPLDCEHGRLIARLPAMARERNQRMIDCINPKLAPVQVEYQEDVLPLTPAGNASSQHLAAAYANKAEAIFSELHDRAVFWSDVLGRSPTDIEPLLDDRIGFLDELSDKLLRMSVESRTDAASEDYVGIAEFFGAASASGAIPCLSWRDGELAGEAEPEKLLDDAMKWGARAVALTPDRNWNIPDLAEKSRKIAALDRMVQAARARDLPLLVGSRMNGPRQKFVDSFDAPEISAYFRDFTDSAFWLYGHTTLERAAGLGLTSAWAKKQFKNDRAAANAFYLEVGKKAQPGKATRVRIANVGQEAGQGDILDALQPLRL